MTDFLSFEGPEDTLFLLDHGTLRILTGAGEEAVLPWGDFLELLVHLSVRRVRALTRLRNQQLRRLAIRFKETR